MSVKTPVATVETLTHDASTLGGNSGSALIDPSTGFVLGLHFGGRYLERNYAVPARALAEDPRVADAGVSRERIVTRRDVPWLGFWDRLREAPAPALPAPTAASALGEIKITIPLEVSIRVGVPRYTEGSPSSTSSTGKQTTT